MQGRDLFYRRWLVEHISARSLFASFFQPFTEMDGLGCFARGDEGGEWVGIKKAGGDDWRRRVN